MTAAALPALTDPAVRSLQLDGTTNFRDLGGYANAAGRSLRWGRIYRADHLAALSERDLQELRTRGIRRTVDFRGVYERTSEHYDWPQFEQHAFMIEPTVVQRALALVREGHRLSVAETVSLMQDTYRSFVHDNADRFARLFQLLLSSDAPLVFHCTAGKDRTGWAAALILLALDVPREEVERDYMLTNQLYRRPATLASAAALSIPQDILDVLWRVQLPFLHAALEMVEREHGSTTAYLQDVLGVDAAARQELARLYLEPAA